jgi:hypothetical protein
MVFDMTNQIIDEAEFEHELFRETAYSSQPLGVKKQVMRLKKISHDVYEIEWFVDGELEVVIGIWTEDNKVTDYDGVFEICPQALVLLEKNGFDVTEVRDD